MIIRYRQNSSFSGEEHSLPKHSKIDEIVLMHLLKRSAGDDRGVEAHILGLDGIQMEGIHSAGTGTKLLAVLV